MIDIAKSIDENIAAMRAFHSQANNITLAGTAICRAFSEGNKLLICGNGGSAADCQHIAAELVGRYKRERKGLPAIALTTDSSILTAWSNDYNYETVFARQIESLGKEGDILLALSTSGNSPNVLQAVFQAKQQGMSVISLTGKGGGQLKEVSDIAIVAPTDDTARIQECHQLAYHILCDIIDTEFSTLKMADFFAFSVNNPAHRKATAPLAVKK
jgi:D-sedoheptulose 7-phosphate isomerase